MGIAVRALRERITLLQRILIQDDMGGFQEQWNSVATTWGFIQPLYTPSSRGENIKGIRLGGREIQSLGYKVILNFSYQKVAFQKIKWNQRFLALTTPVELDPSKRFAICYASELRASEQGE